MTDSHTPDPSAQQPSQPPYGPPSGAQQPSGQYPPPGQYPPGQYPAPGYYPRPPMSENEARTWASAAHWAPLVLGFFSAYTLPFLAPMLIWLLQRERSWFVGDQGKESLNFQITAAIVILGSAILAIPTFGLSFILTFGAWIVSIIWGVQGAVAANRGEVYRYPVNFRFIK